MVFSYFNLSTASNDNSLSEQLNSSVQTRVLKLELENKKLLSTIENLQDSAFHRNNERILDLEKEKKRLTLQVLLLFPRIVYRYSRELLTLLLNDVEFIKIIKARFT